MSARLTTNVDKRLLNRTSFPQEFNTKVDLRKVNVQLIKSWVGEEITRIYGQEDDVVIELVNEHLESSNSPNIKELQIQLSGFLDKDAPTFCQTLWKLCLSAQDSPHGVPKELLEAKKAELAQAKAEEDKAREEAIRRQEAERERERDLARIRDRERSGRGRGRGGRSDRDFDRRTRRFSRSPPPRRRRDDDDYRRPPPRIDSYVPDRARRRRSPSSDRDISRSRTPPARRRRRNSSSSRSPPPRRSRNTSSERSISRDRGHRRRRSRSPLPRRRSRSPRERRQRTRSRSPPPKRTRRASPSPARPSTSRSRSRSPPRRKKNRDRDLAPDDLMSTKRRRESFRDDSRRLSRDPSVSDYATPPAGDKHPKRREDSTESASQSSLLREKALKAALLARKDFRRRDSGLGGSPPVT